ncbi:Protein xylosyltransferase [Bertholletia excelsa]
MPRLPGGIWKRFGLDRPVSRTAMWRPPPLKKGPATTTATLFLSVLLVAACLSSSWINTTSTFSAVKGVKEEAVFVPLESKKIPERVEIPLNCSIFNLTQTCPRNYPITFETGTSQDLSSNSTCPDYFRWIHEDLRPFQATGITRDMVERARRTAHFRLVIVKGKLYVEKYRKSIQTRDVFTIWGILQLLRRYPGRLPDLELMFDCDDRPVIPSRDHRGPNSTAPPPLFRYCSDRWSLDIVFPDWSFWGWAEINIKPWESILKEIKEGNKRIKWMEREPYAYWKGNPFVAETRQNLLTCNVTDNQDWNARLFIQDWILESKHGYKQSELASQCTYRYKIYIEGYAWSVSEKYILACDSVTLLVKPLFHDFFTRSLQPVHHYWPVRDDDKCRSIKFAVDWGNSHKQKAQAIGRAASDFMQEELKMNYVYDYMFHLLNEYAKLLKFEPRVPEAAEEVCSERMVCGAGGLERKFMMESLERGPSTESPCTTPPPYEPRLLGAFLRRKFNSIKQVEAWEQRYWETLNKPK